MIKEANLKEFTADKNASIKFILDLIDKNKNGIALIVDERLRLLGTITDGDIRRFILKNGDIDLKCEEVMNTSYVFSRTDNKEHIVQLMTKYKIRQIPVLNHKKRLIKFYIMDKSIDHHEGTIAVIMAGGEGKRIKEISGKTPKPLLKVKSRPILEEVILSLKKHNITRIYLALNYKADVIRDYFQDGSRFGVEISYILEKKKLGTAGALSLLPKEAETDSILVMNADVLTSTNYKSLIRFYKEHYLLMCIAAKEYIVDIPFGVFNVSNGYLVNIQEKPSQKFFCNAGIYVISREILKLIPRNKKFDMTDLIKEVTNRSLPVGIFPLFEYWIDIGNTSDYKQARKEYHNMFKRRVYK